MSAATRLAVSGYGLAVAWLFAAVAPDGPPAAIATVAGAALVLGILAALRAAPPRATRSATPALLAVHRHDRDRRGVVVRLADPDAPGRPRPRAPGHPFAA